jgi:pyruvate dehydrogenase E2 component (dihydrolipoamide acetyltransferase)
VAEAIYLPKVGMTMEEGTLCRWLAPDGSRVSRGQPVFEMETEKVQMEVETDHEGVIKHLVAEGARLRPGDVVACLLVPGEEVPQALLDQVAVQLGALPGASQSTAAKLVATPPGPSAPATSEGSLRISPIARRLADEHGIDVSVLSGSGPDGRIVERDVQRVIDAKSATPVTPLTPAPEAPPRPVEPAPPAARESGSIAYQGRRRTIGNRMHESQRSMAQLTLHSETAMDEATKMLHGLNREWRKDGVVVTLTALLVRACALALQEHPRLNARLEGERIVLVPEVNVGIALDQENGLMVGVVQDAAGRSLKDVTAAVRDLTEKAKAERLRLEDVSGGSFTVTSLEGTSVDAFTPIINPPQAAILGIGRVREVAAFDGPAVVRRQVATLSLTFDHRVTDGAPAARFLDRVAELLDRPYLLM